MKEEELRDYYNELQNTCKALNDIISKMEDLLDLLNEDIFEVRWSYYKQKYNVKIGSCVVFNNKLYEVDSFSGYGLERPDVWGYKLDPNGHKTSYLRNLMNRWKPAEK